jgi:hypothetical protein
MAAALNCLGGERAALAPVTNAKAMTPVIDGLAVRSRLIVIEGGDSVFWARFVKPVGRPSQLGADSHLVGKTRSSAAMLLTERRLGPALRPSYNSVSRSAFAAFRSAVSKPSVKRS